MRLPGIIPHHPGVFLFGHGALPIQQLHPGQSVFGLGLRILPELGPPFADAGADSSRRRRKLSFCFIL